MRIVDRAALAYLQAQPAAAARRAIRRATAMASRLLSSIAWRAGYRARGDTHSWEEAGKPSTRYLRCRRCGISCFHGKALDPTLRDCDSHVVSAVMDR